MAQYHEELAKAGVLLDASGLQPSAKGFRVKYSGAKRTVTDGPFAETKELVAGYTLIQVESREEAIEWARRFPNPAGDGKAGETRSPGPRRRRSSSSTAGSRTRWRSARPPASGSWTRSWRNRRSGRITSCRACGATSSSASAGGTRPARSSSAPPRS